MLPAPGAKGTLSDVPRLDEEKGRQLEHVRMVEHVVERRQPAQHHGGRRDQMRSEVRCPEGLVEGPRCSRAAAGSGAKGYSTMAAPRLDGGEHARMVWWSDAAADDHDDVLALRDGRCVPSLACYGWRWSKPGGRWPLTRWTLELIARTAGQVVHNGP